MKGFKSDEQRRAAFSHMGVLSMSRNKFAMRGFPEVKILKDEKRSLMAELNNMVEPSKERRHEIIVRLEKVDAKLDEGNDFSYPSDEVLSTRPKYVFDGFVKYSDKPDDDIKKLKQISLGGTVIDDVVKVSPVVETSKQAVFGVAFGNDELVADTREPLKEKEITSKYRQINFGEEYKAGRKPRFSLDEFNDISYDKFIKLRKDLDEGRAAGVITDKEYDDDLLILAGKANRGTHDRLVYGVSRW
jgi:hypothetical protein